MKDDNARTVAGAGAGSRPGQGRRQSSATALDAAQARAALRAVWLVSETYTPAELAERLPASARAEFIEHTPQFVWFLQSVAALIEESVSYHGRLENAVAEFRERARRASDAQTIGELLAEERTRRDRLCAALRGALSVQPERDG